MRDFELGYAARFSSDMRRYSAAHPRLTIVFGEEE